MNCSIERGIYNIDSVDRISVRFFGMTKVGFSGQMKAVIWKYQSVLHTFADRMCGSQIVRSCPFSSPTVLIKIHCLSWNVAYQ